MPEDYLLESVVKWFDEMIQEITRVGWIRTDPPGPKSLCGAQGAELMPCNSVYLEGTLRIAEE